MTKNRTKILTQGGAMKMITGGKGKLAEAWGWLAWLWLFARLGPARRKALLRAAQAKRVRG